MKNINLSYTNNAIKKEPSDDKLEKSENDTLFLDNLSQLRNLEPPHNNTVIILQGYYNRNDLPFRLEYYWQENLNDKDNEGNIIKSKKSQKGRFFYSLSDTINVAQFGIFPQKKLITGKLNTIAKLAASKKKVLAFNKGTYWIDSSLIPQNDGTGNNLNKKGFIIPSYSRIFTNEKTFFKSIPNNCPNYSVICIHYAHNVKINSLNIIGDLETHQGTAGEWGHGLFIVGSKSIQIKNINVSNCWGDGVIFSGDGESAGSILKGSNENIRIGSLTSYKNRRQGLTISNAKNLIIDNINISDIKGVAPACGIDFEPDYYYDLLENIILKNVTTKNCDNSGIIFSLQELNKSSVPIDVEIIKYNSSGERSFFIGGSREEQISGTIKINSFISESSPVAAIEIRDYFNQPDLLFGNVQISNPNMDKRNDFYGSGILIYKDIDDQNDIIGKSSPKIIFDNLNIKDTRSIPYMQHGIFIQNRISPTEGIKNISVKKTTIKGNRVSASIGL